MWNSDEHDEEVTVVESHVPMGVRDRRRGDRRRAPGRVSGARNAQGMRWTAANPDPGPMPPAPTEPGPPSSDLAGWAAHHDARAKLTAWVRGWRRHVVAASVDQLENKDRKTPEQQIAYILGVEFLNPSAAPPFGGIF